MSLAGVDEAGRGPLAGPVVASAVIVRDFSFQHHIDDSKKMTPEARELVHDFPQAADRAFEQARRCVFVAEVDDVGLSEGSLGFAHRTPDGAPLSERGVLERVRSLAIPPAWVTVA